MYHLVKNRGSHWNERVKQNTRKKIRKKLVKQNEWENIRKKLHNIRKNQQIKGGSVS